MEDHILERSIFDSAKAFQKREIKKPGSELYRLKMEKGEPTTLADLVNDMCIGGVMDVMNDLGIKHYRSVGMWGTRGNGENHEVGIALDLDGSFVAYDPTIAQTSEKHEKRTVRIWRTRSSEDLEKKLVKEYGGNWKVKDAIDRANNLNIDNIPIGFYLGGEDVNLDNYFMFEPLPESENWIIENPDMPQNENFRRALEKVLPHALQDCHPLLRSCKGIVQFVDKLEHDTGKGEQMGHAPFLTRPDGKEILTRIKVSLNSLRLNQSSLPDSPWEISALSVILHELYEIDYILKVKEAGRANETHTLDENYEYAEHELIPNIRALRTIKRFFGDEYGFSGVTSGLIVKIPEDLKLWGDLDRLHTDLEIIQSRGSVHRDVVPYLHKDDYNFGNLMDTIILKLKEQKRTVKVRLGVVIGTGALLSISPDTDVDAWLILDNNAFVLEWSQRTITALRHTNYRVDYERWVYGSQQAEEARNKRIDPNEWLEIEKQALGKLHFLNSESRFAQAKQKLTRTPVLFCQGDLTNRQYMEELAQVLQSHNAEITFANLTDVLEFAPPIGDVIDLLPFRDDAVIAHATRFGTTNNHPAARVSFGVEQYKQNAIAEKNLFYQQWDSRR